jgi:hypothetical protein
MAYISLGKIDKSLIIIIVGCVFCFINRFLNRIDSLLYKNSILINIVISPSRFLTIILFIILKIRTKRNISSNEIEYTNTKRIELIFNDNKEENVEGKWKYILLSGIINLIQSIFFAYSLDIKTNAWIFYILIASIFYYFIFKIKLYKHHYLSIILIIITGIILDLILGNLQKDISENILPFLLRMAKEIMASSVDVIDKFLMDKKFCSVYEITFYNGIISLILLGIFTIFNYYFLKLDNFEEYFNSFNTKELLVIFGFIITQLGLSLLNLFTNKNYTPYHIFIIYVFGQLAYYKNFSTDPIVKIICLIFILFMSLVFCEIIELNFFGLSKNTKNNIIARSESEAIICNINKLEDINSQDTGDEDILKDSDNASIYE